VDRLDGQNRHGGPTRKGWALLATGGIVLVVLLAALLIILTGGKHGRVASMSQTARPTVSAAVPVPDSASPAATEAPATNEPTDTVSDEPTDTASPATDEPTGTLPGCNQCPNLYMHISLGPNGEVTKRQVLQINSDGTTTDASDKAEIHFWLSGGGTGTVSWDAVDAVDWYGLYLVGGLDGAPRVPLTSLDTSDQFGLTDITDVVIYGTMHGLPLGPVYDGKHPVI
jgi:hypothetical protein